MDIKAIGKISSTMMKSVGRTADDNGFEEIFKAKVSNVSKTQAHAAIDPKATCIDQGSKVIDLLDRYARELNNPSKTLKDIDPLVHSIEAEVSRLEAGAADYLDTDPALEGFVRNLAITANVALMKYRRGDYL